jgi:hypothetical protein
MRCEYDATSLSSEWESGFDLLPSAADVNQRDGEHRRSLNFRCCCRDGRCHDSDVMPIVIERRGTDGRGFRPVMRLGPRQVLGSD